MVCEPCRHDLHPACPEMARQSDPDLTVTEKAASSTCDCQHVSR
jgi:hypothetical protein